MKPEPPAAHLANGVQPHAATDGQPDAGAAPSGPGDGSHAAASNSPGIDSKPLSNGVSAAAADVATHAVKPDGACTVREHCYVRRHLLGSGAAFGVPLHKRRCAPCLLRGQLARICLGIGGLRQYNGGQLKMQTSLEFAGAGGGPEAQPATASGPAQPAGKPPDGAPAGDGQPAGAQQGIHLEIHVDFSHI